MNKKQLMEYTDRVVAIVELSLRGVYDNEQTTNQAGFADEEHLSRPLGDACLIAFAKTLSTTNNVSKSRASPRREQTPDASREPAKRVSKAKRPKQPTTRSASD